jgi:hypothetical protein
VAPAGSAAPPAPIQLDPGSARLDDLAELAGALRFEGQPHDTGVAATAGTRTVVPGPVSLRAAEEAGHEMEGGQAADAPVSSPVHDEPADHSPATTTATSGADNLAGRPMTPSSTGGNQPPTTTPSVSTPPTTSPSISRHEPDDSGVEIGHERGGASHD